MRKRSAVSDKTYDDELERMRLLKRFPSKEETAARQEIIRVLRNIAPDDSSELHELVSYFVDNYDRCPTPHELIERSRAMRSAVYKPFGKSSCPQCGGTGYVHQRRKVKLPGMAAYEADFSARCECAPPEP